MYVHVSVATHRGQKRAAHSMALPAVVSYLTECLEPCSVSKSNKGSPMLSHLSTFSLFFVLL